MGTVTNVEQIASAENCTVRQVNMRISLAFLTPNLVQAAAVWPRGAGIANLRDAPTEWSRSTRGRAGSLSTFLQRHHSPRNRIFWAREHGIDFDLRQRGDWEERVALKITLEFCRSSHRRGSAAVETDQPPIPKEARMSKDYNRLDKNNAAVLMVDHQAGLLSLVRDIEPDKFKNNVLALADLAAYFKLPTILTTSFEDGPNGPLVPELKEKFPKAPFIPRPGQINAWDNEDFVKAVKATGKKQLIIAGVVTEVCVAFPALSALVEGYEVFVVTDASGTFDEITRHSAWDRMSAAGAQLMTWFAVACELHRDWRNDVEGLGKLFSNHIPDYRNLMTAYTATQAAKKASRVA